MRTERSRRQAFTLVELLMVVAILAMLAAMVFAVAAPARERARRESCSSNLRQVHRAFMMYCADHDGAEVPTDGTQCSYVHLGLPPAEPGGRWMDEYLGSRKVWRCPNDPKDARVYPRSYRTFWLDDGRIPGSWTLGEMVAACGERWPMYDCPYHGLDQGIDSYVIVMRWNGSVKGQYVAEPTTVCFDPVAPPM